MKFLSSLLISYIICLLFSCNSPAKTNDSKTIKVQTIEKDINLNKRGDPPSYYLNKQIIEGKMGLMTLENGFDSIQIRIWYGYAFMDSAQMVILKKVNSQWSAELYSFIYNSNKSGDSVLSIDKSMEIRSPNCGWDSFTKQLFKFNITVLPDDSKIENYFEVMDGDGVVVEISTKYTYRIYSYKEPILYQAKIKEAHDMVQILNLIESEFNFKPLRKRK